VVLVAAAATVTAYALVLPDFFSARAKPGRIEEAAIRRLRRVAISRENRARENPIGLSTEVVAEGRAHFADHCAVCHGNDGRGKTEMGPNFYPPVPDIASPAIQSLSDGEIYYAIQNGIRFSGMPAWDAEAAEDEWSHWKVVHFIRHLPNITPTELRKMERYNPKAPSALEEDGEAAKPSREDEDTKPHHPPHESKPDE
jgi:mono/diheme cytochrome c family protein